MKNILKYAPLAILGVLTVLLVVGLFRADRDNLPSALVQKSVPAFELPDLMNPEQVISDDVFRAPGVKVVNIWASWCGPCRLEHPALMKLAEQGVKIYGINYKDDMEKAKAFLTDLGDPFVQVIFDKTGRTGIDWGVYGVPETFVVNAEGIITFKHIGPIQNDDLTTLLLPEIEKAAIKK